MRELKFRAWDKDEKEMNYSERVGNEAFWCCYLNDIITQWTGLQDKNGKDIYEGDVVQTQWDGAVVVKWSETNTWDGEFHGYKLQIHKSEVIGNLYENPELSEVI